MAYQSEQVRCLRICPLFLIFLSREQIKIALTSIFNKALEQYRKNDLKNCREQLKKYEKHLPNDPILGLYLDRCKN